MDSVGYGIEKDPSQVNIDVDVVLGVVGKAQGICCGGRLGDKKKNALVFTGDVH